MRMISRVWTALRLRCPRCQSGGLFQRPMTMHAACPHCGLGLEPDPGFYLGSIYANYAATVLLTSAIFILAVHVYGFDKRVVLWGCAAITVVFPIWFFRYARSVWLSLMYAVSSSSFRTRSPDATGAPRAAS